MAASSSTKRPDIAAELGWPEVHAFRLGRHHLVKSAPKAQLEAVVGDISGAQAQVMSYAEMQIAVRVECTVEDVRHALWKRKSLVKTWLWRGTLHLARSSDLPIYTGALGQYTLRSLNTWLKYLKLTEPQLNDLFERIGAALDGTPMTREELIAKVGHGQTEHVRQVLRSGWGGILKPAARKGWLCFGPNRGQSVTFVRPQAWLGGWRDLDATPAMAELARRYLRAYGPADKNDFARWCGMWSGLGKTAWSAVADELVDVSVEGRRAQMLKADLKRMPAATSSVQLLPGFDPYLMGHSSRDHLFDKAHRWKVSRVAGWISPVLLVDGRVLGIWTHAIDKGRMRIDLTPFAPLKPRVVREAKERAQALAGAMGLNLQRVEVA